MRRDIVIIEQEYVNMTTNGDTIDGIQSINRQDNNTISKSEK